MKPLNLIDLAKEMVSFETTSAESNVKLALCLGDLLQYLGFSVEDLHVKEYPGENNKPSVRKANLIARMGPRDVDPMVLSGHMDVMPAGNLKEWIVPNPFNLTTISGRLYGRGSVDMKGPIAAMIVAVAGLAENVSKFKRELIFCLTHDEEVGLKGARRIVADKKLQKPSCILIGEPTGLTPVRMHKGHLCLKAVCHGQKAHASRPKKGVNAIELAARVVNELAEFGEELKGLNEPCINPSHTTLNIAVIKGEAKMNEVPDQCEVGFAIRPIPGQSTRVIQEYISHRLTNIGWDRTTSNPLVTVELFEKGRLPTEPMLTRPDSQLVKVAEKVSGKVAVGAAYSTDASVLQQLGADCLIFGPGSIDVAHKPNEFVEVSQLEKSVVIYREIVKQMCLEE